MRSFHFTFAFLTLAFITGCPSISPHSASVPSPTWTIKLTDAPLLSSVDQTDLHATFQLDPPDVPNQIFLGAIVNFAHSDAMPQIIMRVSGQWRIAALPQLPQEDFMYAGVCPARHEIFAILDCVCESPGPQLDIIHSTDGGATWSLLASVDKPTYWATFTRFRMDTAGHGRLTVSYRQDSAEPSPLGYYHYDTTDGGKTWRYAKFEKDDLNDASASDAADFHDAIKMADTVHKSP